MSAHVGVKFKDEAESAAAIARRKEELKNLAEDGPKNLFEAAEQGAVGWIVKKVERSIDYDINQRDRLSRTAIHWAAELGQVGVIEALMDYGADVTLTECNGRNAMHLAARSCHMEVMPLLLEDKDPKQVDAMVNAIDTWGITPVFLALQKGAEGQKCFEFLMKHGARYNTNTNFLNRPSTAAAATAPATAAAAAPDTAAAPK
ncbi:hypothetical protein FOA52_004755 [Chlamydomonas sp. UWO 241]|nr:hypothetical protein FOA52_004755 [Chlamydomonas sp. UWO 241]